MDFLPLFESSPAAAEFFGENSRSRRIRSTQLPEKDLLRLKRTSFLKWQERRSLFLHLFYSSTSVALAIMTTLTLHRLPPEIRLMIWKYVDSKPRVVTIDHATELEPVEKSRLRVQETMPLTLHICQESRFYAMRRYCSTFLQAPTWSYTGSPRYIKRLCWTFGVKQLGSNAETIKKIEDLVNNRQVETGQVCKKHGPRSWSWGFVQQPHC
jgi:hypothetical protein